MFEWRDVRFVPGEAGLLEVSVNWVLKEFPPNYTAAGHQWSAVKEISMTLRLKLAAS